jgi:hypothetical protein
LVGVIHPRNPLDLEWGADDEDDIHTLLDKLKTMSDKEKQSRILEQCGMALDDLDAPDAAKRLEEGRGRARSQRFSVFASYPAMPNSPTMGPPDDYLDENDPDIARFTEKLRDMPDKERQRRILLEYGLEAGDLMAPDAPERVAKAREALAAQRQGKPEVFAPSAGNARRFSVFASYPEAPGTALPTDAQEFRDYLKNMPDKDKQKRILSEYNMTVSDLDDLEAVQMMQKQQDAKAKAAAAASRPSFIAGRAPLLRKGSATSLASGGSRGSRLSVASRRFSTGSQEIPICRTPEPPPLDRRMSRPRMSLKGKRKGSLTIPTARRQSLAPKKSPVRVAAGLESALNPSVLQLATPEKTGSKVKLPALQLSAGEHLRQKSGMQDIKAEEKSAAAVNGQEQRKKSIVGKSPAARISLVRVVFVCSEPREV